MRKENKAKMRERLMGRKRKSVYGLRFTVYSVLFVMLIGLVSAQVIGGVVVSSSRETVSPAWQNVFVYDMNDVGSYREVLVSPDENKYSFVNVPLNDRPKFKDDAIVRAEILDFENGFAGGPVDMNLAAVNNKDYSCSDCDIFYKMEFREVVQVGKPNQELYVSKLSKVNLQLNVYDGCDSFIVQNSTSKQFCWDGCDYDDFLNGSFGLNELEIVTDCHTGIREKKGSIPQDYFANGEWVDYEKQLTVDGEQLTVDFYGNRSDKNVPVVDFVANEYEVFNVSNGGRVYEEDGYYSIEWKENGSTDFNYSYLIKPKTKLNSCSFGAGSWELGAGDTVLSTQLSVASIDLKVNDFWSVCNFSTDISMYLVESVNFSRDMGKKIKNKEGIFISLRGNISRNVSVEFREYIPVEFEINSVSDGGVVEISSSSYNVIVWDVVGDNLEFSYSLVPSVAGDFSFMSSLGGEKIDEENISVYDYVKPIGKSSGGSGGGYYYLPKNKSKVTDKHPLISKMNNFTGALYSKNFSSRGAFDIFGFDVKNNWYDRKMTFVDGYSFENNLGSNSGRFAFEYKANKKELENSGVKDLKFYGTDTNGKRSLLTGMAISIEGDDLKYSFNSEEVYRNIVIYGEKIKLNIWDRFIEWNLFRVRVLSWVGKLI
ncbi:MAG: hypothetical protein PF542_02255 [Nanoarchaeota archaeon]|jgi:hypothetical protein|nr:hypothetical protein [Nanoarchaeota archaeon]